ncbi:hypothetical protein V496_09017 [Pseudogymnoascus sp. VKM F-4515 (FW-2607)]|nr:hypothetical protein V496_09017 [Pseudogymnoascus sp. VKM F-4515 (FW-2607)]
MASKTLALAAMVSAVLASPAGLRQARQSSVITGSPIGFASGATGGGDAAPVYPTTIEDLTSYLTSAEPQVIVISGTFDFVGSEGTETLKGCNSYSCDPSNGGQALLNTLEGCGDHELYDITIDKAGAQGINVASDKTLVGLGTDTVLNGKGLRFVDVENIIVQNIAITNLNPQYVWGGDALSFSGTSTIWIDHVTTSSLGRQHYSFGQDSDKLITISNSFINGQTDYSATCDGHTYWTLELVGSADQITFYKNYVYNTSGRSPALSGDTLFHAVNSVWENNSGHALEGTDTGKGLFEGCVFKNIPNIADDGFVGLLFSSDEASVGMCSASLGRDCQTNIYTESGPFSYAEDLFAAFEGLTVVDADSAAEIQGVVPTSAGNTLST